jgi:hypothetical protein
VVSIHVTYPYQFKQCLIQLNHRLTYWTVFGFFNFLESFALRMVLYYFPFYFVFKTAFVLWLQLPATRGARTIHQTVLRPVLAPYIQTGPAPADSLRTKVSSPPVRGHAIWSNQNSRY